ncbi:MAG: conjugal transfer protein TraF [Desulfuromonadaceae bacterium]|nr:conjugal transfer protein TraF [Desulfuromonadaceae bacterium]
MKKMMAAVVLLGLSLPVASQAIEFQSPGTLGVGRAGVARTTDANATFMNPAGLAFSDKAFSMKLGGAAGVVISSSLADNVDKVGKLDLDTNNMTYTLTGNAVADAAAAASATTKAAQFAGVLVDINDKKGDLAVGVDLSLGFQFRNYGFGIIGRSEVGAGIGNVDLVNIRAGNATATTSVSTLYTDIGATTSTGQATYFSQADYDKIVTSLLAVGATTQAQAQAIVTKLETELKANGNTTGMAADQIAQGLQVIVPSLNASAANSIDNNTTTVLLRGILLAEIPLAYGHKIDLGNYGKLGVGAAVKVMRGTVYSSDVEIMSLKDSNDIVDKVKDNHTESNQFGLDLGALWRLEEVKYVGPINVGLALKNLNSPKFDGPDGFSVKVQPQARLGVGLDPLSWLSIVADMDLTKNKTALPSRDSQLIGGGLEAHFDGWYALWLALRAGAYKNIGEDGSKPVITAGLSLGPQYFRFDVNGAVATDKGRYDNKSVPLEARVEFGLSTAF